MESVARAVRLAPEADGIEESADPEEKSVGMMPKTARFGCYAPLLSWVGSGRGWRHRAREQTGILGLDCTYGAFRAKRTMHLKNPGWRRWLWAVWASRIMQLWFRPDYCLTCEGKEVRWAARAPYKRSGTRASS
ncbi:hypothetical protein TNCT_549271 [Trichonephila clavata]|uniref:Uncharacterized protein n=1 Tax=Trichonephila clavata TaxID=2740835 RepID=A0A8X6K9R6_TRICU|nr:hypothetical protein TNCT_549271 [Trichonephila clavata]